MEIPVTAAVPQEEISSIKQQFKEGSTEQQAKVPTQEEIEAYKDNLTKMYKKELPFLRLKQEYEELMMKQMIRDVETGARPANTVPGILGLEMVMRDISVKMEMGQWKASMEQAEENKKKQEANVQEQPIEVTKAPVTE